MAFAGPDGKIVRVEISAVADGNKLSRWEFYAEPIGPDTDRLKGEDARDSRRQREAGEGAAALGRQGRRADHGSSGVLTQEAGCLVPQDV